MKKDLDRALIINNCFGYLGRLVGRNLVWVAVALEGSDRIGKLSKSQLHKNKAQKANQS